MGPMKKFLPIMLLIACPAWAQTQPAPKAAPKSAARTVDPCTPIGRTAKGELVYSMKCDNLPVPPPPAQAEAREAPAAPPPEPEARGGLFGWSSNKADQRSSALQQHLQDVDSDTAYQKGKSRALEQKKAQKESEFNAVQ